MALGIVSDDIFDSEVVKSSIESQVENQDLVTIEPMKTPGRAPGDLNVPNSIRKIIGDTAVESGNKEAKKMAEFFGVSNQSVTAYKNGTTSLATYNEPSPDLKNHILRTKERITRKAAKGISRAFENLTDEKLSDASAPELASVIRAFSGVIKDMEPANSREADGPGVQFVFFTPPMKQEDSFDVIDSPV